MSSGSSLLLSLHSEARVALGIRDYEDVEKRQAYIAERIRYRIAERDKQAAVREAQRSRWAAIASGERDGMSSEELWSGGVVPLQPAQVAPGGPDYEDLETGERFYSREAVAVRLGVDVRRVSTLLRRCGGNCLKGESHGTRSFVSASELARWEAAEAASAFSEDRAA